VHLEADVSKRKDGEDESPDEFSLDEIAAALSKPLAPKPRFGDGDNLELWDESEGEQGGPGKS
jgi:hypothetical protein